jgi:hypothetical protein
LHLIEFRRDRREAVFLFRTAGAEANRDITLKFNAAFRQSIFPAIAAQAA